MPRLSGRPLRLALVVGAAVALAACGTTDVSHTRLEAAVSTTFANLYVRQQAQILGHPGVTLDSIDAVASCGRTAGAKVANAGPGADWVCQVQFTDNTGQRQDGKFEVQVKSNSCFTAGGPSKLVGPATITGVGGVEVTNPVFEFDGCFDPDR